MDSVESRQPWLRGSLLHAAPGISISFPTHQSMANVRFRVSKIDILGQFKPTYHETYFILCLQVRTAMSLWASLYGEFSIRPQTRFPLWENMDVICQTLGLYFWWGYLDSNWTQKCATENRNSLNYIFCELTTPTSIFVALFHPVNCPTWFQTHSLVEQAASPRRRLRCCWIMLKDQPHPNYPEHLGATAETAVGVLINARPTPSGNWQFPLVRKISPTPPPPLPLTPPPNPPPPPGRFQDSGIWMRGCMCLWHLLFHFVDVWLCCWQTSVAHASHAALEHNSCFGGVGVAASAPAEVPALIWFPFEAATVITSRWNIRFHSFHWIPKRLPPPHFTPLIQTFSSMRNCENSVGVLIACLVVSGTKCSQNWE